ncbi:hypothetical protein TOPH_07326 [Tolypocladium ophioglossoides CBS 100239]|uniref:Uncharacterized protein n=1 Tax=Tolypocladium ophioglossoides (strain CBS 100239) TaxID=1163406 RepID=A0A0L0N1Y4_TOLOC|nr:hypothetical protein TOPH_07326 [Tolypocladium ophioglossoides CBS 100239]
MAIFPGGKSTRINSPRHLTLRHSRRVAAAYRREARRLDGTAVAEDDDEIDPLPPGEQKLNSYWAPGLQAGPKHNITVTQSIEASTGETLPLEAEQSFFVDAPQFSLPEGSVHSTYPPSGYPDTNRILPHVVLTDPHLPWERLGSPSQGTNMELRMKMKALAEGAKGEPVRNRVPWLVVLSFSQDELRLPPQDLDGSSNIFRNTSAGVVKPVKQSGTMTVNMSIDDLWKLTSDVTTPVTADLGPESMKDSRGDFIFIKPDLLTSLFPASDSNGDPVRGSGPSTLQYQYLAHVRKINGQGMALAGVEDTAVFSIVIGSRAGPLDNMTSATMCAHLVSIEGVEKMAWPGPSHRYVTLCSLYSWNYTVLPANTLNVPDAFEHLGRTLDVLRAPEDVIKPLRMSGDKIQQLVAKRLDDGYTLVRYRTKTGEATVALYRGPFTPSYVPPLENITTSSSSGVDLQVLDKQLGIMDVTYSVAWQVGRTMALGDEAYTAALNRLRTAIHGQADAAAKLQTVKDIDDASFRTRGDVLAGIDSAVRSLASIHLGGKDDLRRPGEPVRQPRYSPGGAKRRWHRSRLARSELPDLSLGSPIIQKKYPGQAAKAARYLAQSTTGDVYDETNDPISTDWMTVLAWLLDRIFLAGVPAHCLIPDPTYLEPESLRFFRIDNNWVDALIDGALSLGNHYGDDEDRKAIKEALNDYINHTPQGQDTPVQIPSYGFYLRSDLVTMFPDLRVEVLPDNAALAATPSGAPLLRHEIVTDGVMMAFMDRVPGSEQFSSLVFTQPAHQQRFAVARGVNMAQVEVDIRRQYTVEQSIRETDPKRHDALDHVIYQRNDSNNIFFWDSKSGSGLDDLRVVWPPRFAAVQLKELQDKMGTYGTQKPYFQDNAPTSALFAMQLNDPIYNLTIDLNAHAKSGAMAKIGRLGGASSLEIRTLRLMGTARVKKLGGSGGRSGDIPSRQQGDDDDYGADFKRLKSYVATPTALSKCLAPNVRALPFISVASLPKPAVVIRSQDATGSDNQSGSGPSNQPPERGPAGSPKYQVCITSNIVGHWDVVTLDKYNLAQDLIFSIILQQDEVSQNRLVEVDLQIDLGALGGDDLEATAAPTADPPHFLMRNYTGPGAHMLTNLRFNVLPAMVKDEQGRNLLRLRLLPRSAKGWVYATTVTELSFLLGLASMNAPKKHIDQFQVESWADYMRIPNGGLGPDNILRITNPDTVVTVVNPEYAP